jgi:hypothetical protein
MTELWVNDEQVTLPENFTTEVIEGNPFVNPIGETSLDVDVSLLEPSNAYIFGYLQRANSTMDVASSLPCRLHIDVSVKYGRCVILEFSDESVKLQLLFKNSIFSHAIDEKRKLRELNLGTAAIDKQNIVANLDKTYPEVDFQLLMAYDAELTIPFFFELSYGDLINRYTYVLDGTNLKLTYGLDGNPVNTSGMFGIGNLTLAMEDYRPQPYLSAIIKKVIEALGFTLGVNDIANHPVYKYCYIVNNSTSLKFADMLPDWTVRYFIEQIQIWQNCRFIFNDVTRVVNVVYNHTNYENPIITELEVLDDFTGEPETMDPVMNRERNIDYNLPDTDLYKYAKINDIVRTSFSSVGVSGASLQNILTAIKSTGVDSKFYYADSEAISFHLLFIKKDGNPLIVNDYPALINRSVNRDIDEFLDIIPAEMQLKKFYIRTRTSNNMDSYIYVMVPVVRNTIYNEVFLNDNKVEFTVEQAVQDPSLVSKETTTSNVMQIALYAGNKQTVLRGLSISQTFDGMPEPFTRSISGVHPEGDNYHTLLATVPEGLNPLSLQYLNDEIYLKEPDIDTTKKYRFRFFRPMKKLDITNIFLIHGEYYIAYQFEKTIDSNGMGDVFEGEFFKVRSLNN